VPDLGQCVITSDTWTEIERVLYTEFSIYNDIVCKYKYIIMNYNGVQFTRKGVKNDKPIGQGKGETFGSTRHGYHILYNKTL